MYTRKNQRDLTRTEKRRLVDAILKLKRSGRYDDFVVMHREYYVMDTERRPRPAHMTSSFFPWHRQYLLEFEKALQRVDAGVSVPYWDWTQDDRPTSSLWAEDFLGGNGRQGDRRVTTGAFAYEAGNWSVGRGVTDEHYLTRNFGRPGRDPVSLPTKNDVARALKDPVYDTEPWNSVCTEGFRNRIEGWGIRGVRTVGLHNRVHQWVGGPMAGAASPRTRCSGSTTPTSTCCGTGGARPTPSPPTCRAASPPRPARTATTSSASTTPCPPGA